MMMMLVMMMMLIAAEGQPMTILWTSNAIGEGQAIEISNFAYDFWYPITVHSQQWCGQAD